MKKVLTSLLVLALVGAFVAGCTPAAETAPADSGTTTTDKEPGGE